MKKEELNNSEQLVISALKVLEHVDSKAIAKEKKNFELISQKILDKSNTMRTK